MCICSYMMMTRRGWVLGVLPRGVHGRLERREGKRSSLVMRREHVLPFLKCSRYRPMVGRWFGRPRVALSWSVMVVRC